MKNYLKIFAFIALISGFNSCNKDDELIVFDAENGQTLAQFSATSGLLATPADGVTSLDFSVLVTTVSSVDRTITFDIDTSVASAATADQYSISNLVIPANSYTGTFTVTSNFANLPEEGSSFLVINLTGVEGSSNAVFEKSTLTIELYRKCPVVAGDYTFRLVDVYGDGWQGSKIIMTIDGASQEVKLPNYYDGEYAYGPIYYDYNFTVTVPEGTEELSFEYVGGSYPEETYYEIYSPNNILIYTDGDSNGYSVVPAGGLIPFNPCNS